MWINPKIKAEREASAPKPPTPTGETLLELERSQGTTLRLAVDEFNGSKYVSLSTWNADGWPVKGKTLSFRLRELPDIIAALSELADGDVRNCAHPQAPPHAPDRGAKGAQRGRSPDGQHAGHSQTPPRDDDRPPWEDDRPQFNGRGQQPRRVDPNREYPTPQPSEQPFDEC